MKNKLRILVMEQIVYYIYKLNYSPLLPFLKPNIQASWDKWTNEALLEKEIRCSSEGFDYSNSFFVKS